MTIAKKKWLCFGIYRPPKSQNLASFSEELTDCLSRGNESNENFIILKVARELDKLQEFCDLFNLTNLIRCEICFTRDHISTINSILTHKPKSFQNICITETGLSDSHKLIPTFFQSLNYLSEAKSCFLPKLQAF